MTNVSLANAFPMQQTTGPEHPRLPALMMLELGAAPGIPRPCSVRLFCSGSVVALTVAADCGSDTSTLTLARTSS